MSNKAAEYTLHYWGGIPGRGEFVRLAFAYAGVAYKDPKGPFPYLSNVQKTGHPPHLSPPIVELPNGKGFLSQTSNILNYLAPKLGLDGVPEDMTDEEDIALRRAHVNQIMLSCLDFCCEAHDTHHPIASSLYYEEQKAESLRRSEDFRQNRIPKYLKYFALVLKSNPQNEGAGRKHLVGNRMTTADLSLYHVLCGVEHAFPKRTLTMRKEEELAVVWEFMDSVGSDEKVIQYLEDKNREDWGLGLFRHYPELDAE